MNSIGKIRERTPLHSPGKGKNNRGLSRAPMNNGCSSNLFVLQPACVSPNYESDAVAEGKERREGPARAGQVSR